MRSAFPYCSTRLAAIYLLGEPVMAAMCLTIAQRATSQLKAHAT